MVAQSFVTKTGTVLLIGNAGALLTALVKTTGTAAMAALSTMVAYGEPGGPLTWDYVEIRHGVSTAMEWVGSTVGTESTSTTSTATEITDTSTGTERSTSISIAR
jgi:hypothetical protein